MFKHSLLYRSIQGAAVIAASSLAHHAAIGQEGKDLRIEEIYVSARKTEENIQDIPIALDAISNLVIDERGINSVEGIAQLIPGLMFDTGLLANDTRPVIRSVTSARGRSNVAILIDDVDVTSESLTTGGGGMTGNLRLMDLERVEVVKGPQSVLYGRSAFSGAINYISKRPEQEFSAVADIDVDENDSLEFKLGVTGAVTDTIAARFNFATWDSDGEYENPNSGGNMGGGESTGASLALEWLPNDIFTGYTRIEYTEEEYDARPVVSKLTAIATEPGNFGTGVVADGAAHLPFEFDEGTVNYCASEASRSQPFIDAFGIPGTSCRPALTGTMRAKESDIDQSVHPTTGKDFEGTSNKTFRTHLDLRWEYDTVEFRSISGYTDNKVNIIEDFDLTNYDLINDDPRMGQFGFSAHSDATHELEQYSHEFRIVGFNDDFDWFVSALYWKEELTTALDDRWWAREGGSNFGVALTEPAAPGAFTPMTIERKTEHGSLAASISYNVTDAVSVTFEGRYIDETVDYKGNNAEIGAISSSGGQYCTFGAMFDFASAAPPTYLPPSDVDPVTGCGTSENSVSEEQFIPRASISWEVSEDALLYATYAEGFKPSGVVTADANADISDNVYDSEQLESYELGFKTAWFDNSVYINGAAFYYDYTDQQVGVLKVDPASGIPGSATVNAGSSSITGIEIDTTWQATEALWLNLGYIYSNAEYDDYNLADISGGDPSLVSPTNKADAGNAEADYSGNQMPLSSKHAATINMRYEHLINNEHTGFAEVNGIYQSKRYLDDGNNAYLPEHSVWNMQAGVETDDWRIIVYVDNVLDDDKIKSGITNTDYGNFVAGRVLPKTGSLILPPRRTIGARLKYKF